MNEDTARVIRRAHLLIQRGRAAFEEAAALLHTAYGSFEAAAHWGGLCHELSRDRVSAVHGGVSAAGREATHLLRQLAPLSSVAELILCPPEPETEVA